MSSVNPNADATPLPEGILCPECGYDLRSLTSARCPECGFGLAVVRATESQIPWSRRQELGWFPAYWQTVWQVTVRPQLFSIEMARGVDYGAAQRFRFVTLGHAYVPLLVVIISLMFFEPVFGQVNVELIRWFMLRVQIVLAVWLLALPGLGSYFFQGRQLTTLQENRAIALSYYAWGPLAWSFLALPPFVAGVLTWSKWGLMPVAMFVTAGAVYVVVIGLSERKLFRFSRYTLRRSFWGSLLVVGVFNVLAVVLLGLISVLILVELYVRIVLRSLSFGQLG